MNMNKKLNVNLNKSRSLSNGAILFFRAAIASDGKYHYTVASYFPSRGKNGQGEVKTFADYELWRPNANQL